MKIIQIPDEDRLSINGKPKHPGINGGDHLKFHGSKCQVLKSCDNGWSVIRLDNQVSPSYELVPTKYIREEKTITVDGMNFHIQIKRNGGKNFFCP